MTQFSYIQPWRQLHYLTNQFKNAVTRENRITTEDIEKEKNATTDRSKNIEAIKLTQTN